MARILLPGTLDTKGEEYAFVRAMIHARKHETLVIDLGVLGEPAFTPDIPAEEVARAGGASLSDLRQRRDRGSAVDVMLAGASRLTRDLYAERRFAGVLGLGGGGGTTMITALMRELPVGVPKVMVSTRASGKRLRTWTSRHHADVLRGRHRGTQSLSRRILPTPSAQYGMLEQEVPNAAATRPLIAATMFGVTTRCY